jgi:DNA-binding PadR family transcriptional regulator
MALTDLDYALLGLLVAEPRSGYGLRKVFQTTPLGAYSDSPGSIYPALRKLEGSGHLTGTAAEDARGRRTLRTTAKGKRALVAWLETPITAELLTRDSAGVSLRLAFVSDVTPGRFRSLLEEYRAALLARLADVEAARRELEQQLSPSAWAAVDLGVHVLRARAEWCAKALRGMPS